MNNRLQPTSISGFFFYTLGILLSTLLITVLTWANLEADFYGFQRFTNDRLDGLICPILMTPNETGLIRLEVKNSTGRTIEPIVRIDTSGSGIPYTQQSQLTLPSGQAQYIEQKVSAENIDLRYFIFAKAFRYPAYPLPSGETTCGIFIVNLPFFSGSQIYFIWLGLSLVFIAIGAWIWFPTLDEKLINATKTLAIVSLMGLLSVRVGWGLGLLFLVLTLLLGTVILRAAATKK